MSTKTLRKRIALVAVSALGAGLLTVVAVPSANAALATGAAASELYISTTESATGAAAPNSGAYSTSTTSVGFIADTSAAAATATTGGLKITDGSAKTATVYAGAQISFSASNTSTTTDGTGVVVTGGTLSGVASGGTPAVSGDRTIAAVDSGSAQYLAGVFTINAPVGSTATIAAYSGASVTGVTTASSGALLGYWTFTVVAASTVGVYDAAESIITTQACVAAGATSATTVAYDSSSKCRNGYVGIIYVELNDAYTGNVTGGALAATSSAGKVYIEDSSIDSGDSYLATSAFSTVTAAATNWIVVTQPTSGVAGSSTVTITYKGAVIATKTISWVGDVAAIKVISTNKNFQNGQTDTNFAGGLANVVYVATDAAGNAVTLGSQPTVSGATGSMLGASLSTSTVATIAAVQTSSAGYGYSTMNHPGGTLYGAGTYKLKVTNSAGTAIYSDVQTVTVADATIDSFTASWDKAAYNPGDIATLTISVKDQYGNAIATGTALAGLTAGLITNSTGFTAVGGACTDASTVSLGGTKTCKFSASNTAGAYAWSVDLDTSTAQAATVGTLTVNSGGGVSNADVLKAIVSLIASINKQIAALQKALLKK